MSQLTASDLFAISCGTTNQGPEKCYWCASAAPRLWKHEDPPPPLFIRRFNPNAKCTSSIYQCYGCWRFGWKRLTIPFLGGGFKDGQCLANHSLWVTEEGVWGIRVGETADREALYEQLLKPPLRFALLLAVGGEVNYLNKAVANDHVEGVKAETELGFTLNNTVLHYSPYELDAALRGDLQGKSPGVRELVRLLGEHKLPPKEGARPDKMDRGRPKPLEDGRQLQKLVAVKSGSAIVMAH